MGLVGHKPHVSTLFPKICEISVFFQLLKNHNSVNSGRIKKSYLKKNFKLFFLSIKKCYGNFFFWSFSTLFPKVCVISVFFQLLKNHNSVNFGRIKKSYLKKKKKKKKKIIQKKFWGFFFWWS